MEYSKWPFGPLRLSCKLISFLKHLKLDGLRCGRTEGPPTPEFIKKISFLQFFLKIYTFEFNELPMTVTDKIFIRSPGTKGKNPILNRLKTSKVAAVTNFDHR